ncbi:MAG: geranylgeranylglycerol-phosphate geranylgeranyltransferase [Bacteroidia bacterium]|nr:geranylgeranylglycerol-phosphate geranylgeranyltransferase [Bacteroidia bacterium]NNM16695.1 geranylgeranylglycerol-phosphate geranylgeranyltransferase [Bacteroidia bacterium]
MLLAVFKLVRPLNLLIIASTQILFHYFLIRPLLILNDSFTSLSSLQLIVLVLSTLLIAAGGYIINDIKDIKVDIINKPDKVIINNEVSRAQGLKFYVSLTALGILLGIYLAYSIDIIAMGAIHFLSAGLLFFYSTSYKKIFLLGTFIISIITALSILIVLLFDMNAMHNTVVVKFVFVFALFSFLVSLVREIIKDIEDIEGDRFQKAATLPLITSINTSKNVTAVLIGIIITFLLVFCRYLYYIVDYVSLAYVCIAIVLPLFILLYLVVNSFDKEHFSRASALAKLIMVLGILYIPIFYLVLFKI